MPSPRSCRNSIRGLLGSSTPKIEGGVVTELSFLTDYVGDISPVRALPGLKVLHCDGSSWGKGVLSDLGPVAGMSLESLSCHKTNVSDLTALKGMPLTYLDCGATQVSDLSPLQGKQLTTLICYGTKVSDLSPLRGMPLETLSCNFTSVSDLTPLERCQSLKSLSVKNNSKVTAAGVAALQKALPNCKIEWDDPANTVAGQPNKPWNTPAFQQWMKTVVALPAERQAEAVAKKLQELNPGFDGKLTGVDGSGPPKVENGVVTEIGLSDRQRGGHFAGASADRVEIAQMYDQRDRQRQIVRPLAADGDAADDALPIRNQRLGPFTTKRDSVDRIALKLVNEGIGYFAPPGDAFRTSELHRHEDQRSLPAKRNATDNLRM